MKSQKNPSQTSHYLSSWSWKKASTSMIKPQMSSPFGIMSLSYLAIIILGCSMSSWGLRGPLITLMFPLRSKTTLCSIYSKYAPIHSNLLFVHLIYSQWTCFNGVNLVKKMWLIYFLYYTFRSISLTSSISLPEFTAFNSILS